MKFRTEIDIPKNKFQFNYNQKLFLIGSCFTKNIGNKLNELKFDVDINPFGVLYNPLSVKNSLDILLNNRKFTFDDLQFHNDLWFSYSHHSSFSHSDKQICLNQINDRIKIASQQLMNSDFLFITFGTSYVYQLKKTGEIVSNCHKIPAKEFKRSMIPSCEIYDEYLLLINTLRKVNPKIKIVLTLSPVRHLKDGFVENQHSKSNLLMAIHQMLDFMDDVFYFPAYEIMMDDLRDYRFYDEDLVHPNKMAVNYIWDLFKQTFIESSEFEIMKKIDETVNATNHRPFNVKTEAHQKFIINSLKKIEKIESKNKKINLEKEKKILNAQLI
jgi:GSCFA family